MSGSICFGEVVVELEQRDMTEVSMRADGLRPTSCSRKGMKSTDAKNRSDIQSPTWRPNKPPPTASRALCAAKIDRIVWIFLLLGLYDIEYSQWRFSPDDGLSGQQEDNK